MTSTFKLSTACMLILSLSVLMSLGCSDPRPAPPGVDIFTSAFKQNISDLEQHMGAGTDPNQWIPQGYNWAGASPLHIAVLVKNEDIIQLLIDNGADINIAARDSFGGTPLQWAAFWGIHDVTEFLVMLGADINAPDRNGCTPLCASTVPNDFIGDDELKQFEKERTRIQSYLKSKGAK